MCFTKPAQDSSLAPRFRFKTCFLPSQWERLPLRSLLYSFIVYLHLGILERNLHLDKRSFVLVFPPTSSAYWARINVCSPTGPVRSPVTLTLFKLHCLYPFSVSQTLHEIKYYWNKRNILTKLKRVSAEAEGMGLILLSSLWTGSAYKDKKDFSVLLSLTIFPQFLSVSVLSLSWLFEPSF